MEHFQTLIPAGKGFGRPREVDFREILNAIRHLLCAAHGMPMGNVAA